MVNFQVVDNPLAYSVFLGRPFLATTTATIPMHYLFLKIPTLKYVIIMKRNINRLLVNVTQQQ